MKYILMKRIRSIPIILLIVLVYCISSHAERVSNSSQDDVELLIIGGVEVAPPFFYTFMGRLSVGCGGSLISPRWVLTAAHCGSGSGQTVRWHRHDLTATAASENGFTSNVGIVINNPGWPGGRQFDVSLWQLTTSVDTWNTDIEMIEADVFGATVNPGAGSNVRLTGWGQTGAGEPPGGDGLRQVDIPIVTTPCPNAQTVCAGTDTQGACFGDSGGPLFPWNAATRGATAIATVSGPAGAGSGPCSGLMTRASFGNVNLNSAWLLNIVRGNAAGALMPGQSCTFDGVAPSSCDLRNDIRTLARPIQLGVTHNNIDLCWTRQTEPTAFEGAPGCEVYVPRFPNKALSGTSSGSYPTIQEALDACSGVAACKGVTMDGLGNFLTMEGIVAVINQPGREAYTKQFQCEGDWYRVDMCGNNYLEVTVDSTDELTVDVVDQHGLLRWGVSEVAPASIRLRWPCTKTQGDAFDHPDCPGDFGPRRRAGHMWINVRRSPENSGTISYNIRVDGEARCLSCLDEQEAGLTGTCPAYPSVSHGGSSTCSGNQLRDSCSVTCPAPSTRFFPEIDDVEPVCLGGSWWPQTIDCATTDCVGTPNVPGALSFGATCQNVVDGTTCLAADVTCPGGASLDPAIGSPSSVHVGNVEIVCVDGEWLNEDAVSCLDPAFTACNSHSTDPFACVNDPLCGWCDTSQRCIPGTAAGPQEPAAHPAGCISNHFFFDRLFAMQAANPIPTENCVSDEIVEVSLPHTQATGAGNPVLAAEYVSRYLQCFPNHAIDPCSRWVRSADPICNYNPPGGAPPSCVPGEGSWVGFHDGAFADFCFCSIWRKGPNCDVASCLPLGSDNCSGHGTCVKDGFKSRCVCLPSGGGLPIWSGTICDKSTEDTNGWGDPHYVTLDEVYYDYYGLGTFVFCRAPARQFDVLVRTFRFCDAQASWPMRSVHGQVALRAPNVPVISIGRLGRYEGHYIAFGGVRYFGAFPATVGTGSRSAYITRQPYKSTGKVYHIQLASGETLVVEVDSHAGWDFLHIKLALPASDYYARTEGLCGSYNGVAANDLTSRSGQVTPVAVSGDKWRPIQNQEPLAFAESWRVNAFENFFTNFDHVQLDEKYDECRSPRDFCSHVKDETNPFSPGQDCPPITPCPRLPKWKYFGSVESVTVADKGVPAPEPEDPVSAVIEFDREDLKCDNARLTFEPSCESGLACWTVTNHGNAMTNPTIYAIIGTTGNSVVSAGGGELQLGSGQSTTICASWAGFDESAAFQILVLPLPNCGSMVIQTPLVQGCFTSCCGTDVFFPSRCADSGAAPNEVCLSANGCYAPSPDSECPVIVSLLADEHHPRAASMLEELGIDLLQERVAAAVSQPAVPQLPIAVYGPFDVTLDLESVANGQLPTIESFMWILPPRETGLIALLQGTFEGYTVRTAFSFANQASSKVAQFNEEWATILKSFPCFPLHPEEAFQIAWAVVTPVLQANGPFTDVVDQSRSPVDDCKRAGVTDDNLEVCAFAVTQAAVNPAPLRDPELAAIARQRCLAAGVDPDDDATLDACVVDNAGAPSNQPIFIPDFIVGKGCPDDCCNHGRCIAGQCVCDPGWAHFPSGKKNCCRRDPVPDCVHGKLLATGECRCDPGWCGLQCDVRPDCREIHGCLNGGLCSCLNECLCPPGFAGPQCERRADCSDLNSCNRRGECVDDNRCQCQDGFLEPDCLLPNCNSLAGCSGHGTCVKPNTCQCNPGWTGADCSEFVCEKSCGPHGRCVGPNQCECDCNWTGPQCSVNVAECPLVGNCHGRGCCKSATQCLCNNGFRPPDCRVPMKPCKDPVLVAAGEDVNEFCAGQAAGTACEWQCPDGYEPVSSVNPICSDGAWVNPLIPTRQSIRIINPLQQIDGIAAQEFVNVVDQTLVLRCRPIDPCQTLNANNVRFGTCADPPTAAEPDDLLKKFLDGTIAVRHRFLRPDDQVDEIIVSQIQYLDFGQSSEPSKESIPIFAHSLHMADVCPKGDLVELEIGVGYSGERGGEVIVFAGDDEITQLWRRSLSDLRVSESGDIILEFDERTLAQFNQFGLLRFAFSQLPAGASVNCFNLKALCSFPCGPDFECPFSSLPDATNFPPYLDTQRSEIVSLDTIQIVACFPNKYQLGAATLFPLVAGEEVVSEVGPAADDQDGIDKRCYNCIAVTANLRGIQTQTQQSEGEVVITGKLNVKYTEEFDQDPGKGLPGVRALSSDFPWKVIMRRRVKSSMDVSVGQGEIDAKLAITEQAIHVARLLPSLKIDAQAELTTSLPWPLVPVSGTVEVVTGAGASVSLLSSVNNCPNDGNSPCLTQWRIAITPNPEHCKIDYSFALDIELSCAEQEGCPLTPDSNTALLLFAIESQEYCAQAIDSVSVFPTLEVYANDDFKRSALPLPQASKFVVGQNVYFRLRVQSPEVTIQTTSIEEIELRIGANAWQTTFTAINSCDPADSGDTGFVSQLLVEDGSCETKPDAGNEAWFQFRLSAPPFTPPAPPNTLQVSVLVTALVGYNDGELLLLQDDSSSESRYLRLDFELSDEEQNIEQEDNSGSEESSDPFANVEWPVVASAAGAGAIVALTVGFCVICAIRYGRRTASKVDQETAKTSA